MPGGDRTGPAGAGSMSGRGAGFCAGNSAPGFINGAFGFGGRGGAGRGRCFAGFTGRGYRNRLFGFGRGPGYPVNAAAVGEKDALNSRAELLQNELDAVKERLAQISG